MRPNKVETVAVRRLSIYTYIYIDAAEPKQCSIGLVLRSNFEAFICCQSFDPYICLNAEV